MTDAVTPASDATAISATPRPRRTWDLILTIVLLIAYLLGTLVASFSAFFLAFAGDSCGASSVCDYDQMSTGMMVALVGVWVPVVGGALTIAITIVGWVIATTAVRPLG